MALRGGARLEGESYPILSFPLIVIVTVAVAFAVAVAVTVSLDVNLWREVSRRQIGKEPKAA